MNLKIKKPDLICLLFFLHQIIYLDDGDIYRNYKLLFVSLLSIFIFRKEINFLNYKREKLFYVLFFFILFIQQFFITDGNYVFGAKFSITFLLFSLPYWLFETFYLKSEKFEKIIGRGIDILFFICLINYLFSFLFGFGETYSSGGFIGKRAFGVLGDSFIPILSFLQIYYFSNNKKLSYYLSILFSIITSGKIGILLSIFIFILDTLIKGKVKKNIAIIIVLGLFTLPIIYFNPNLNIDYSFNNRYISYLFALDYFKESPLFGIGINGGLQRLFGESLEFTYIYDVISTYNIYQVHNTLLRVLSETGIVGFICILGIYFHIINTSLKVLRITRNNKDNESNLYYSSAIWLLSFLIIYQGTAWLLPGHPIFSFLLLSSSFNNIYLNKIKK